MVFFSTKKLILVPLLIALLVYAGIKIYPNFSLLIEKLSLKPPPPARTLSQVKEVMNPETGKIKYPQDYTIVLVGDSMTERLGNSDELRGYLNEYYPDKTFEVLNYGFGSTNILSLQERLEKETFYKRTFRPILDIDFDLILIESFGHNPLSQFKLEEGLKKQEQALDKIVLSIKSFQPRAKIIFIATIAPNKVNYALTSRELNPEKRIEWAEERNAYIKNHIKYANSHNIPLVNVYQKSLDDLGDGKLIYISEDDYIHPSPTGVLLISKEIANFIAQNKLLGIN